MPGFGPMNDFGQSATWVTLLEPRGKQLNSFPGLDGIECLDMGDRGGRTVVSGVKFGASPADGGASIEAWFTTWLSLRDGVSRDLTDINGTSYSNVLLDQVVKVGRVRQSVYRFYFRQFELHFLHLG